MSTGYELDHFYRSDLEHFNSKTGIANERHAIRVAVDYDAAEAGKKLLGRVERLLKDPKASAIKALVIGEWEEAYDTSIQPVIDTLVANASKLPALEALFVGEMIPEVNEISWINQGNYSALWAAYPNLKHFQARGSNHLALGNIKHASLETLILESGGLTPSVLKEVINSSLPNLTHLELYLGDENYGWASHVNDVIPLLSAEKFPKLTTLGLRDAMEGDALAALVAANPFIKQLDVLDLSLGTMGDIGGKALLASPHIKGLKKLDLHYNYLSKPVADQLSALSIKVDVSDPQEEYDEGERYVAVAE